MFGRLEEIIREKFNIEKKDKINCYINVYNFI